MPRYVGPHNDRELELMLAGKKPAAIFAKELDAPAYRLGDELFAPHVMARRILRFVVREDRLEYRYYCLPTEEWRIKLFELIRKSRSNDFSEDDLHRLDGALLGYSKSDIEKFIDRLHRTRTPRK